MDAGGPARALWEYEMIHHPDEHSWTVPKPRARRSRPLPPHPLEPTEQASRPRGASRPGAVSTKAMLASLLSMGAVGAGALFLMHSAVRGDSPSQMLGLAELPATAAPVATLTPTSSPPIASPVAASETSTATPVALPASPRPPAATPPAQLRPRRLPRVRLYPFPVPTPPEAMPTQRTLAAQPLPEETSSTNPYDEAPATATTAAAAAPTPGADIPSDNGFGGRD
jgi:hypothetical protein